MSILNYWMRLKVWNRSIRCCRMMGSGWKINISICLGYCRIKADIARTNISQLRNELDGLKMQMHKYDVSIDEISREIANLNRVN